MKKINRLIAVLLTIAMMLTVLPAIVAADGDDNGYITVHMSFEGFTIGHGFFVEPTAMRIPAGSTLEAPTRALLTDNGFTYSAIGAGTANFGISRIRGLNAQTATVSPELEAKILEGIWGFMWDTFTPNGSADGSLGNSDFFMMAGWMFTIEHHLPDVFAGGIALNDGDVIRWQFSLMAGPDIGFAMQGMGLALYEHVDKSDLIRALSTPGITNEAREAALAVIINPFATVAEVTEAIEEIEETAVITTEYITVFVSFEGFNLGHGFYVKPTAIEVPVGTSAMDASLAVLRGAGIQYGVMEFVFEGVYGRALDRIYGIHPGIAPNPPEYITITLGASAGDGSLGAFDYAPLSGWLNTVNHHKPFVGADAYTVVADDVIRWQFSVDGLGGDMGIIGEFGGWGFELYEHADKTALIRAMFADGARESAIPNALDVIINPLATANEVQAAINALLMPDWEYAMNRAFERIVTHIAEPGVRYIGGEWAVLTLARAGVITAKDPWLQSWFKDLDNTFTQVAELIESGYNIQNPPTTSTFPEGLRRWTDFQRVTLALTSLGFDATDFNGHDLTELYRMYVPDSQRHNLNRTVNVDIFALLALDSLDYEGDRTPFIEAILRVERNPAGWSLAGNPDPEITGMALAAFAPYYDSNAEVRAAVDRAVDWLAAAQNENGGWGTNAHGPAQVIVGLTALGIDPTNDSRFITESGNTPISALLSFQDEATGGFLHGTGINVGVNQMTTEQAAYALVAYWRFRNGMNSLYDMRDAERQGIMAVEMDNRRIVRVDVNLIDADSAVLVVSTFDGNGRFNGFSGFVPVTESGWRNMNFDIPNEAATWRVMLWNCEKLMQPLDFAPLRW